jgi:hypothetical protein
MVTAFQLRMQYGLARSWHKLYRARNSLTMLLPHHLPAPWPLHGVYYLHVWRGLYQLLSSQLPDINLSVNLQ